MTLTLNGTSGVTTPGISNSEGYTGDGLTIAAGAPAGAVTLDASGNLGVGTSSPIANFHTQTAIGGVQGIVECTSGSSYLQIKSSNTASVDAALMFTDGTNTSYFGALRGTSGGVTGALQAYTGGAVRMTLDASGNLLVGTTTALGKFTVNGWASINGQGGIDGYASTIITNCNGNVWYGILIQNKSTTGSNAMTFCNSTQSVIGSIGVSATATSFNTSSDYRLKENVAPLTNALDKIASLKPCSFTWKADGSADRGFIAHELQEVIPQAVSGEKDAVDDKGNIMPQGVDYGKITPEIVAAIQEQQAMITELKARIEQLEAK